MNLNNWLTRISVFLIILVMIGCGLYLWLQPNARTTQDYIYNVLPGESLKTTANGMEKENIIPNAYAFILLTLIENKANHIQAGEYLIAQNSSLAMILDKITKGEVILHAQRIGEGWTFAQLAQHIQENVTLKKTLDWTSPNTILQQLKLSDLAPEGIFYPETYLFPRGYTDVEFLTKAFQQMQTYLNHQWQQRAADLPFATPYEALIAASVIEKETGLISEQDEIAGVIVRRLQKKMPLQMDPTVVFGLGAYYERPLTKADLAIDTPYNTYLHYGLPPTPIAIPSLSAIHAALHPKPGNSLYFVARGDGGHVFSETLDAHNQAVEAYRQFNQ